MTNVTIIGAGNMGSAITALAAAGGHPVQVLTRKGVKPEGATAAGEIGDPITGEVVILALPYGAVDEVLGHYTDQLDGVALVDLTNPVDFATFDSLVVPADSSAAAEIAAKVPGAHVLKAFNTTFAGALAAGTVAGLPASVLIAGDDADAKAKLAAVIDDGGLKAVDAGPLKRARELEAIGFEQMVLASGGKTSWTSGFVLAD